MEADHANLYDLEIIQLVLPEIRFLLTDGNPHKYRWKTFSVGEAIAHGMRAGKVDFIPSTFAEIPYLFHSDSLNVKVAIIQTSPPDSKGFLNLGIVADVVDLVIKNAPISIAEINPNVPITHGETSVHINQFDYFTESDQPLLGIDVLDHGNDDIADRIGWHVGNIIEDGSTIAIHFGSIYSAIANHLKSKKNIRICSHTVSDWAIGLIESGALALDRGIEHQGIIMTSSCFGSARLYDYVNNNPFFDFVPLFRASYQASLPNIPRLVSIINAHSVDITGNAVVLNPGDYFLPGFEGKLNFSMAATMSRNGKSIVTVRSLDKKGNSNIVISHEGRQQVRSTLGTTRYVVTEYGIASIAGKSIRERTLAIIDIAHPDHREALIRQAKETGLIYKDQIYVTKHASDYPFSLETVKTFANNQEIKFRPIKPSDEDMMRRLFYGFSDKSKYMRYFTPIRVMPHIKMQPYVNIDYNTILSIVGTIQHKGSEKIIAEARYALDEEQDQYEMAFVVVDEFQGMGIAKFMLNYLISIARDRGIKNLYAVMMPHNTRMAKVFESTQIKREVTETDEEVEYIFDLSPAK
jgi:acyl-CoA hydrolase/RimJ/RimL family protein N-acetyltransferase